MHLMVWIMVLNATFNNISDVAWRSVLLVEEIGFMVEEIRVLEENHRPVANH